MFINLASVSLATSFEEARGYIIFNSKVAGFQSRKEGQGSREMYIKRMPGVVETKAPEICERHSKEWKYLVRTSRHSVESSSRVGGLAGGSTKQEIPFKRRRIRVNRLQRSLRFLLLVYITLS